jgi:translation initiation factor 1A
MCTIRGTLKNRVWINNGDIILVGLREFGDEKGDVILKYYDEEAKELKELGEIPEHIKINEGDFGFEEDGFNYVDGEEEKEEEDLDIDTVSIARFFSLFIRSILRLF